VAQVEGGAKNGQTYTFGSFRLREKDREYVLEESSGGQWANTKLGQTAVNILLQLVQRPQLAMTRNEIQALISSQDSPTVGPNAVDKQIGDIRRKLRDPVESQRYVKTLPRVGYMFVAQVERAEPAARTNGVVDGADHWCVVREWLNAPDRRDEGRLIAEDLSWLLAFVCDGGIREGTRPAGDSFRSEGTNLIFEPSDRGGAETLACDGCVVVVGGGPVRLYGIRDRLVLRSSSKTVIMPFDFTAEDIAVLSAAHKTAVRSSKAEIPDGLKADVVVCGCPGLVAGEHGDVLELRGDDSYPVLERNPDDFLILRRRQEDEPRLVKHLLHVARASLGLLRSGKFKTHPIVEHWLTVASVYHDFGGTLVDTKEKYEREIRRYLEDHSLLKCDLLDSRIVEELVRESPALPSRDHLWRFIEDSTASTVDYLRLRPMPSGNVVRDGDWLGERDAVTVLLASQEVPELFLNLSASLKLASRVEENVQSLRDAYGCLKTAENLVAARWKWKRAKENLLLGERTQLEALAGTCRFTYERLRRAGIDAESFLTAMLTELTDLSEHRSLVGPETVKLGDSAVARVTKDVQEDDCLLVADRLFIYWFLFAQSSPKGELETQSLGYLSAALGPGRLVIGSQEEIVHVLQLVENVQGCAPSLRRSGSERARLKTPIRDWFLENDSEISEVLGAQYQSLAERWREG
jgi:DNA-binding winged helix-turn-helix (wHTH) protein